MYVRMYVCIFIHRYKQISFINLNLTNELLTTPSNTLYFFHFIAE